LERDIIDDMEHLIKLFQNDVTKIC